MTSSTLTDSIWKKTPFIILVAAFCCALWGSAFPLIKIGYELFNIPSDSSSSQILFAGVRFSIAGLMVILTGSFIEKRFLHPSSLKSCLHVLIISFFQTMGQYFFFYIGLAHTSGSNAAIIEATNTFFCILWACLVFQTEKISFRKICGCIIGFAGVCLIELNGSDLKNVSINFLGDGFVLISCILSSLVPSFLKYFTKTDSPFELSGYQFFTGGIIMTITGLLSGGKIDFKGVTAAGFILLFYLAFISACAHTLWTLLLKVNDVSHVSIFGFFNPVFGFILSAILLKETSSAFSWSGICSLILVCAGIILVYLKKNQSDKN